MTRAGQLLRNPGSPACPRSLSTAYQGPFVELCLSRAADFSKPLTNSENATRDAEKLQPAGVEPLPIGAPTRAWLETERRTETQVLGNNTREAQAHCVNHRAAKSLWEKKLAPQVGFEPTTLRLTAECSTIELLRSKTCFSITTDSQSQCQIRPSRSGTSHWRTQSAFRASPDGIGILRNDAHEHRGSDPSRYLHGTAFSMRGYFETGY